MSKRTTEVGTGNGEDIYIELLQGRDGNDGEDGEDGRDGRDGVPGLPGRDGKNGEKGEQGARGQNGDTGYKGEQGARGEVGPMGTKGSKGDPGVQGPRGQSGGGGIYTRWGRTTCPNTTGTELVYSGRVVGSHYSDKGGGANYLCLPEEDPDYLSYEPGHQTWRGYLYGIEYETAVGGPGDPLSSVHNHNVPCAICHIPTRSSILMIPGRTRCPSSWTTKYFGYLMSNARSLTRTMFECLDKDSESIPGSVANSNPALFYTVETSCNGIPCPPYYEGREVTCVVCTK